MLTPTTTPDAAEVSPAFLRAKRRAAGITQAHLAGLAGVSLAFVGNLERGYVPSHSEALPRILEVLAGFEDALQKDDGAAGNGADRHDIADDGGDCGEV